MSDTEHYETLIVGGGKAGKTLAADLARAGRDVVLVERGLIGGTCVNVGCIPSKALINCADVAAAVARAGRFGTRVRSAETDMPAVLAYKRSVVAGLVYANWKNLHGTLGDRYVLGEATFVAPRSVEVVPASGGPARRVTADNLFINLGGLPTMPLIPGLADAAPLTSTSVMELDAVPQHLIILGGGHIGVEFGQAFLRFGSRVTIIQRRPSLLATEDSDVSDAIEAVLSEDGLELIVSANTTRVEGRSGDVVKLSLTTPQGDRTVVGSHLLVAVGRSPATADVGLSDANVEVDSAGYVVVNDRLETSAARTWALGDCAGSPQQTHVALDDYRIVKANVFAGGGRSTADRLIPQTLFIDPEYARVGLTEKQARDRNADVRIARASMALVPRARTLGDTRGFMKAVIDAASGRVLGFAMLGHQAGEVTAVVQMAMQGNLPFATLRDSVIAHPTMAEGLNLLFANLTN